MSARRPSRVSGPPLAIVAVLLALGLLGLFAPTASARMTYKSTAQATRQVVRAQEPLEQTARCDPRSNCRTARPGNSRPDRLRRVDLQRRSSREQDHPRQRPAGDHRLGDSQRQHSCVIGGLTGRAPESPPLPPGVEVAAPSALVLTVTPTTSASTAFHLTGGQTGINVIDSSQAVTITGNWIGVKLDGTAGGNSGAGVFIDPDSNGARHRWRNGRGAERDLQQRHRGRHRRRRQRDHSGQLLRGHTERHQAAADTRQGHRDHRLDRRRRVQSRRKRGRGPVASGSADRRLRRRLQRDLGIPIGIDLNGDGARSRKRRPRAARR